MLLFSRAFRHSPGGRGFDYRLCTTLVHQPNCVCTPCSTGNAYARTPLRYVHMHPTLTRVCCRLTTAAHGRPSPCGTGCSPPWTGPPPFLHERLVAQRPGVGRRNRDAERRRNLDL